MIHRSQPILPEDPDRAKAIQAAHDTQCAYDAAHGCCPWCGSDSAEYGHDDTLFPHSSDNPSVRTAICSGCGWKGIVHEMVADPADAHKPRAMTPLSILRWLVEHAATVRLVRTKVASAGKRGRKQLRVEMSIGTDYLDSVRVASKTKLRDGLTVAIHRYEACQRAKK